MRIVVVTGMSGAGKSQALRMLEDVGYFCVDNLPVELIENIVDLVEENPREEMKAANMSESEATDKGKESTKLALGVDIRSGRSINNIPKIIGKLKDVGHDCEVLFLDASNAVLVKRYKETRRLHPIDGNKRLDELIDDERRQVSFLKENADYLIDTSTMITRELKVEIEKIFVSNKKYKNMYITLLSFGFKYGIPADTDMVFDVRFLPNPFYIPQLKPMTGNDQPVYDYVLEAKAAHDFLDKLEDMVEFLIPSFLSEGRHHLVVSIGCTGGKHRSVTIANALFDRLKNSDYGIKVEHRDIEKDAKKGR